MFSTEKFDSFMDFFMTTFAQELVVIIVFLASAFIFSRMRPSRNRNSQQKLSPSKFSPFSKTCASLSSPRQCADVDWTRVSTTLTQQSSVRTSSDSARFEALEQQMLQHLQQHEFTRALNIYRGLERTGGDANFGEDVYSIFIQSAIRVKKLDVVERMLRSIRRKRLRPSVQFFQMTLRMLSSRKHFATCLSLHALFADELPLDKVVYSCLVNAALETDNPESAKSMLDAYERSGLDPNDYVLFFRTHVALNDVDAAEAVFRKLGDAATYLMLNLLLLTCVKACDPERALGILCEAHRQEQGKSDRITDVVSYNTVIKGFAQAKKPHRCFDCFRDLISSGLEPDDITFGTLLDACIADDNVSVAQEIIKVLLSRANPTNTILCTVFMKGLVRANCVPKALELYEEMKRRKAATPDIVTYSVLIKALVDEHDLERALLLVKDMNDAGLRPDDIILTHLLEGCRYTGNHAMGTKLFDDFLASGVKPSEFTLVTMLKLHGRCGANRQAYELISGWAAKFGMTPSVIHYTCVMSGCVRTKNYDLAWKAYLLMCENGVMPDETALSTLLPGLVAAQEWDRVILLTQKALKCSRLSSLPAEIFNNALSQMLDSLGPGRHSEQLLAFMKQAGIPITARRGKRQP